MVGTILKSAFLTVATLFGGLLLGLVAGDLVFRLIPGSSIDNVKLGHALIAAAPALAGFLAGGAAWGVAMGRVAGVSRTRRMAVAGMVGFGPITIFLAAGPALVRTPSAVAYGLAGWHFLCSGRWVSPPGLPSC